MLLVTPVFLIRNVSAPHIWLAFPFATIGVFIAWLLHIRLIRIMHNTASGGRFLIVSGFMILLTSITYMIGRHQHLGFISEFSFLLYRVINILAINAIVNILIAYIQLSQTKKKLDIENEQLKFVNLQSRYELLHNQLNPHFLFNSIGTAKALIRKDPLIADEYLVKLSSFLRAGLETKTYNTITVQDELALCQDYIALQQMRFDNALQFETKIDEKYLSYSVPYFALLTLVENAVKHNTMTEDEPLRITVTSEDTSLIVENNIQQRFLLESSSKTGLQNLSERYRLLYHQPVTIENDGIIFRVIIKMIRK